MKKRILLFIVLLLGVTFFYLLFVVRKLPNEYQLWTDDKYWHTALLNGNEVIVPPTVVDYHVLKNFIVVLSVNRDSHYSKTECESCLSHSLPCSQYWIINWETGDRNGPMDKATFLETSQEKGIRFLELKYDISNFSGNKCNNKS